MSLPITNQEYCQSATLQMANVCYTPSYHHSILAVSTRYMRSCFVYWTDRWNRTCSIGWHYYSLGNWVTL